MRLLVFSDLHANTIALDAALAAVQGRWERTACLGDIVGYGPDPNEAVQRVRGLDGAAIRGNHDRAASGVSDAENFSPIARMAVEWTRAQLRDENTLYLRELPAGPLQTGGLTLVHGAVQDEDEYVFAPSQALEGLLQSPGNMTFFGHTHFQGGFSFCDERLELIHLHPAPGANFAALRLERGTKYLLNPGSIGQPRDGDPRAAFAIADLDHGVVEFWRVPYDIEAVQERLRSQGAPDALVMRLAIGR